ncbi:unnamed protein product [Prunus brigantina]
MLEHFQRDALARARGPLGLHSCFQRLILARARDGLHQPGQGPRQNQPTILPEGYDGVSARNQIFYHWRVTAYFPQTNKIHVALPGVSNPFFHY